MIPKKIKAVRELLGISEAQVSNTIYVNSYKYKRSEGDVAYLTTEMLILLSIIYRVPFEKFLLDVYTIDDIICDEYLNSLKGLGKDQIEIILKDNLCLYFPKKRKKANSTTIDLIKKNERTGFHNNLKFIRENLNYEVSQMAKILEIETEEYVGLETRSVLPNPTQLKFFLGKLDIKVSDLIISAK